MPDLVDDGPPQRVLRHPDGAGFLDAEAVEDPVEERLREVGVVEAFVDLPASFDHPGAEHEPDFGDQRFDRRAREAFRFLREDLAVEHIAGADAVEFRRHGVEILEELFPVFQRRRVEIDYFVDPSRADERRVERIGVVRRHDDEDPFAVLYALHVRQQAGEDGPRGVGLEAVV